MKGNEDCLEIIIQAGVDIVSPCGQHGTPLEMAIKNGHIGCARLIRKRIADDDDSGDCDSGDC